MIKELKESREEVRTVDGIKATRVWSCTWAEYQAGEDSEGNTLPNVGDQYPEGDEMYCTEYRSKWLAGQNYCQVTAQYSSQGNAERQQRADQLTSWNESFDISLSEASVSAYVCKAGECAGETQIWEDVWLEYGPSTATKENAPDLQQVQAKMSFNITVYGSLGYIERIKENVGKINSDSFMDWYQGLIDRTDSTTTDINKWMFYGCRASRIAEETWRYDFLFVYDGDGWQYQYNIALGQYSEFSMQTLFDGLSRTDPDDDRGGNRE